MDPASGVVRAGRLRRRRTARTRSWWTQDRALLAGASTGRSTRELPAGDAAAPEAKYLRRAVGLWAQHPTTVELKRTVMGEQGRGYTMLCSYAKCDGTLHGQLRRRLQLVLVREARLQQGGFDYAGNQQIAQLGDHTTCSGDEYYLSGSTWVCGEPDHWTPPQGDGQLLRPLRRRLRRRHPVHAGRHQPRRLRAQRPRAGERLLRRPVHLRQRRRAVRAQLLLSACAARMRGGGGRGGAAGWLLAALGCTSAASTKTEAAEATVRRFFAALPSGDCAVLGPLLVTGGSARPCEETVDELQRARLLPGGGARREVDGRDPDAVMVRARVAREGRSARSRCCCRVERQADGWRCGCETWSDAQHRPMQA